MSDITERLAGPMPPQLFLETFLESDDPTTLSPLPRVSRKIFSSIKPCSSRQCIEETLAHAITIHGFCPNFSFEIRPEKYDRNLSRNLRPRLCLFSPDTDVGNDWQSMEFFVVVNDNESVDPFAHALTSPAKSPQGGHDAACQTALEELESYFVAQLSRQHRRWIIALYVIGQRVRFLRIDRAGLVVTAEFNYVRGPRTLIEFFWRYSYLSPSERGFDATVTVATALERRLLSSAVIEFDMSAGLGKTRPYPNIQHTLSKDYPAYKIEVTDKVSSLKTQYIVRKPCFDIKSPFGRTTRGYVALKLDGNEFEELPATPTMLSEKLVFLKDCWRHYSPGVRSERGICQDLAELGISHIPHIISGGDVYTEKHAQHTLTQKIFNVKGLRWIQSPKSLSMYVHHRVVQKLAFPLHTVRTAKEMVQVLRDALQALIDAYMKARVLHRDISINNILVSSSCVAGEAGRGILNDWDISRKLQDELIFRSSRAGTWRFMSIALLENEDKPHSIHDDLESIFWVLTYCSVHHFKHGGRALVHMFDEESILYPTDRDPIVTGGAWKHFFLRQTDVRFHCSALDDLIHAHRDFWRRYHNDKDRGVLDIHQRLEHDPSELLDMFDAALCKGQEAWAGGDFVDELYADHSRSRSGIDVAPSISCHDEPRHPCHSLAVALKSSESVDKQTQAPKMLRRSKRRRRDACDQEPAEDAKLKVKRLKRDVPRPVKSVGLTRNVPLRRSSRLQAQCQSQAPAKSS
ncbi:hypothetical protein K474DRAFT_1774508 [Panus rudis PR-1116 ss-1]|nr:hypothetical protein K474DRAFT_1774508 [Panus rudis PR-1116 ss-1]